MWHLLAQHEAQTEGGLRETIDTLARTPLSQIVIFVSVCTIIRIALYGYLRNTAAHRRHGIYSLAKFFNEAMDAIVYAGVFVFMLIRPFAVQAFLIPSGSMLQTLYVNDFIVANKAIYRYSEPKPGDIVVFKPPQRALDADQRDVDFIKRCIGVPGDVIEIRQGQLFRNRQKVDEPYLSSSPGQGAAGNGNAIESGVNVRMTTDWKLVHYQGKARPELVGKYIPVQINYNVTPGRARYNYGYLTAIAHEFAVGDDDGPNPYRSAVQSFKPTESLSTADLDYERELEQAPPAQIPKGFVLMMGDNRQFSYDGRAWGLVPREDVIGRSEFIWLPPGRWRVTR